MAFREVLDDGTLGKVVMTDLEFEQKKQRQKEEFFAQVSNGEKTPQELQDEISFFNGVVRKNIIIREKNGLAYDADVESRRRHRDEKRGF